jgi:hypothetical protein
VDNLKPLKSLAASLQSSEMAFLTHAGIIVERRNHGKAIQRMIPWIEIETGIVDVCSLTLDRLREELP